MRSLFIVLLTVGVVTLAVAPGLAHAQDSNVTVSVDGNESDGDDLEDCTEHIDRVVSLCSAEYRDGRIHLEFIANRTTRITVTDAGSMMAGGEIPQRAVTLRGGERSTTSIEAQRVDGFAGVSVDTARTLYGVPVESSGNLIGGPWTHRDAQISALGAGSSVSLMVLFVLIRAAWGRDQSAERVA